jgi:hypothetical protein
MLPVVVAIVCTTRLAKLVPSVKRSGSLRPPPMSYTRRFLAAVLAFGLLLGVGAPAARADGDPASDVLPQQDVFYGSALDLHSVAAAQLDALTKLAAKRGYAIKVAVISQIEDMGSVSYLYGDPTNYAQFLGGEIGYLSTKRLLIVMPEGYAILHQGHSSLPEQDVLDKLPPPGKTAALLPGAIDAVVKLAAHQGVKLAVPAVTPPPGGVNQALTHNQAPPPGYKAKSKTASSGTGDWAFAIPVLVLLAVGGTLLTRNALRRRRV